MHRKDRKNGSCGSIRFRIRIQAAVIPRSIILHSGTFMAQNTESVRPAIGQNIREKNCTMPKDGSAFTSVFIMINGTIKKQMMLPKAKIILYFFLLFSICFFLLPAAGRAILLPADIAVPTAVSFLHYHNYRN